MNADRWEKLSANDELRAIAAEVARAKVWERKDKDNFKSAIERALELIDLSLSEPRWKGRLLMLLYLRTELTLFYTEQKNGIETLYATL